MWRLVVAMEKQCFGPNAATLKDDVFENIRV
jgi:hypothetical protein